MTSLLLCGATIWMWVRSYYFDDQLQRTEVRTLPWADSASVYEHLLWFGSTQGKIAVMTVRRTGPGRFENNVETNPALVHWYWSQYNTNLPAVKTSFKNWKQLFGFGYGSSDSKSTASFSSMERSAHCLVMPWAVVALIFAILPALWGYMETRERKYWRRKIAGHCVSCGYDLRGAGGVCPECGRGS